MQAILDFLREPWPWYVGGPLIGLTVPLMLIFLNKPLGISSSLRHVCAMCFPGTAEYFKYDWRDHTWNMFFVFGILLGSFLLYLILPETYHVDISDETKAHLSSFGISDQPGLLPKEIFSWEMLGSSVGWIMIVLGGFLVGFGTRYANGCTSGHTIMGLSLLNIGSLVATIGFFIGGLICLLYTSPSPRDA